MFDLDAALRYLVEAGGSDLHLKVPSKPLIRVDGELEAIPDSQELERRGRPWAASSTCSTTRAKLEEFATEREVDFAYSIPGVARFRVNAFYQRGSVSLVVRAIPINIRTIEDLNLPPVIRDLADEERGIVLLTGTTGSGKSTTLAAMIDHINSTQVAAHRDDRGPDRVPAPRQALADQPARGRLRHRRRSSARCAASCVRTRT